MFGNCRFVDYDRCADPSMNVRALLGQSPPDVVTFLIIGDICGFLGSGDNCGVGWYSVDACRFS